MSFPAKKDASVIELLERELAKLRKINQVLMNRVEKSTDWQGNAFSLFQAATVLEGQVAERTQALRAANDALSLAKDQAEQANISKTKFLAAASHDLMQPLNAAKLFTAALAERGELGEKSVALVSGVASALDSIDGLLHTLFEISKLDAGVMVPEITSFALGPLLSQLEREYRPQVEKLGLELHVVPCAATVRSDARLLTRVLWNFLSNAIRYTERGRILLGCRHHGSTLSVEVWDTGLGIPKDRLAEIFQEFRQVGLPGKGRDKGLGLGLAIVHRMAKLLNHPIEVRSRLGKGSAFAIQLPLDTGSQPVTMPVSPSEPAQAACPLQGLKVAAIDDDKAGLRALTELLNAWDCEVTSMRSSSDVGNWLALWQEPPDIIVADYHLSDTEDGWSIIQRIRNSYGRTIPALVVSSNRTPELRTHLRKNGVLLVNKPIAPAKLRAAMSHLIAQGRAGDP